LDKDKDDYIRTDEIREFLASHGFYATDREIQVLISRFDFDNRNSICFD